MSNKQIHQLTAQSSLDSTFVIPVQKADGSESATKTTIESLEALLFNPVTKTKKTTITSAEILSIFDTPIVIVPAVANKIIVPVSIVVINRFGTVAYSIPGAWNVKLEAVSVSTFNSYLSASFDKEVIQSLFFSSATTSGSFINEPLKLTFTIGNPSLGDGDTDVYVNYYEVTI